MGKPCFTRDAGQRFSTAWGEDGLPRYFDDNAFNITFGMTTNRMRKVLNEAITASNECPAHMALYDGDMFEVWEGSHVVGGAVIHGVFDSSPDEQEATISLEHQMFFMPETMIALGMTQCLAKYVGDRIHRGIQDAMESSLYKHIRVVLHAELNAVEEHVFIEEIIGDLQRDALMEELATTYGAQVTIDIKTN